LLAHRNLMLQVSPLCWVASSALDMEEKDQTGLVILFLLTFPS